MGTLDASFRFIFRALNFQRHWFRRCRFTCVFQAARKSTVFSLNGKHNLHCNNLHLKSFNNPIPCIPATGMNKLFKTTLKYFSRPNVTFYKCNIHSYVKLIRSELNRRTKKGPLFIQTSLFLSLLLCFKKNVHNTVLKFAKCEFLTPMVSSSYSATQKVPVHRSIYLSHVVPCWISLKEFFYLIIRAISLLCVFSPLLITYPLTYVSTSCFTFWLHFLYIAVEYSGATFIKLGQWASTRRDLFSEEFCDLFYGLHHEVHPHPWSYTVKALEQAYGRNWQQILNLSHNQKPIGSGCIAQVYRGYVSAEFVPMDILKNMEKKADVVQYKGDDAMGSTLAGGEIAGTNKNMSDAVNCDKNVIPVAIKVLHPNVREAFQRDLKLMKVSSQCLTYLFPKLHWISLTQCVEEFAITMHKQLDMRYEFHCLERFAHDFHDFPNIRVPQPLVGFVRQNILVETFEEGINMTQILRSPEHSVPLKKALANLGLDVLLQMVFVNNFVHADLHPGNLLIQNIEHFKEKKNVIMHVDAFDIMMVDMCVIEESSLKLVLLDCGITTTLSSDDRQKFREVFTAVVRGQGEVVADLFLSKSSVNQCTNPELFRKEMAQLIFKGTQNLRSISSIKVAELMHDLFAVLSKHKIQLESNFATIILAIAMLEGLGRTLDPTLNLMEKAKPLLLELSKKASAT